MAETAALADTVFGLAGPLALAAVFLFSALWPRFGSEFGAGNTLEGERDEGGDRAEQQREDT